MPTKDIVTFWDDYPVPPGDKMKSEGKSAMPGDPGHTSGAGLGQVQFTKLPNGSDEIDVPSGFDYDGIAGKKA